VPDRQTTAAKCSSTAMVDSPDNLNRPRQRGEAGTSRADRRAGSERFLTLWIQTRAPVNGDLGGTEAGTYFVEAGLLIMCRENGEQAVCAGGFLPRIILTSGCEHASRAKGAWSDPARVFPQFTARRAALYLFVCPLVCAAANSKHKTK
jgi:hypothetical protein